MKKRHSYAATDNIILDVRSGEHLMGDEFLAKEAKFDVTVIGTAPLATVEVLRNNEVCTTWKFKEGTNELKTWWQDLAPLRDAKDASFYYVRVTQTDGQMAWSSPMWVRVGK